MSLCIMIPMFAMRKSQGVGSPEVGNVSRYFVDASLTVLRLNSAEVPPTTKAR